MVEDQREVRILGGGIEDDRNEGIDSCLLGDQVERPSLLVSLGSEMGVKGRTCLFLNWMRVSSFLTTS